MFTEFIKYTVEEIPTQDLAITWTQTFKNYQKYIMKMLMP